MKLLKELSEAHGVPGKEDEVRRIMKREFSKYCEVEVDTMGNIIAQKGSGGKKVMLAAHMDEIVGGGGSPTLTIDSYIIVKHIDEKGFLRFITLGGFYDPALLNQRVYVHTEKGKIQGVIGSKPPHLMKEGERKKTIEYRGMFIDVGARNRKDAGRMGVNVGDYITFDRSFSVLRKDMVTGKAFDNRLGCYVILEVAKRAKGNFTLYAVGTTQEGVGLKGTRTSAYRINLDIAIVVDATTTGDHPGVKEEASAIKLGKGPAITVVDAQGWGLLTHPKLKELLINTAKKHKIPYQLEVGTTDATAIQLTQEGVSTGVVSIPSRYIHTPVSVANMKDVENCIKLITHALERV